MQSIKKIFKQYWLNFLLLACYTLLFFFIIPSQEQLYITEDQDRIKKYARFSLIILGAGLAVFFIGFSIKRVNTLESIGSGFGGGVVIFFFVFLCLKPFVISGYYLMNKLYVREQVEKRYTIVDSQPGIDYWLLKETVSGKTLSSHEYPCETNWVKYKNSDTVRIKFKRGLLGVNHSPQPIVKDN